MTNPNYTISDENPNEIHGVRACSAAGQQKHPDCDGKWKTLNNVRTSNVLAPFVSICAFHLAEMAGSVGESARLGYAAPPSDFRTPIVVETAPKPPRRTRAQRVLEEVPAL